MTTFSSVDALSGALSRLPDQERLVLSLVYLEELAEHDIAEVLRLPESRVTQIRRRAASRVRRLMGEVGAGALYAA